MESDRKVRNLLRRRSPVRAVHGRTEPVGNFKRAVVWSGSMAHAAI